MSIRILKSGILDSFQDEGRYGFQHIGINPNGVLDRTSFKLANQLVNNKSGEAVLELHFPCSRIQFNEYAEIAITGANFSPHINQIEIKNNFNYLVNKNDILEFKKPIRGRVAYLSIQGGFQLTSIKNSYSTNLLAKFGGYQGRKLQKDDLIRFQKKQDNKNFIQRSSSIIQTEHITQTIAVLKGPEYEWLDNNSKDLLLHSLFTINPQSNRMGYYLEGNLLKQTQPQSLISSAVLKGTIQLLPIGKMLALMADHQTIGGYPRILQINNDYLDTFAQLSNGVFFKFNVLNNES